MQCPSCHQETAGAFCSFCGATLAAAPAGSAAAPAIPTATTGGLSENAAAAIAYLTIIPSIIFLVLDPYKRSRLVRFHSIQNIALAVAWVIFWIGMTILHLLFHAIPFIFVLFWLVELVVGLGFFVAWLIALIKASKGEFFKLPVIGDFAERQAGV